MSAAGHHLASAATGASSEPVSRGLASHAPPAQPVPPTSSRMPNGGIMAPGSDAAARRRAHALMSSSTLPAAVASLRLPSSLPPRDLTHMPYMPSPLSPESPMDNGALLYTPPTTPQDAFNSHVSTSSSQPSMPSSGGMFGHNRSSSGSGSNGMSHALFGQGSGNAVTGGGSGHLLTHDAVLAAETKRAQNRKSAKRFREAQKVRWKAMQDENAHQRAEIERLRGLLQRHGIVDDGHPVTGSLSANIGPSGIACGGSTTAIRGHLQSSPMSPSKHEDIAMMAAANPLAQSGSSSGQQSSRSAMSIDALVSNPTPSAALQSNGNSNVPNENVAVAGHRPERSNSTAVDATAASITSPSADRATSSAQATPSTQVARETEAEAALYAQILGSVSPVKATAPYAAELGVLLRCFDARTGVVLRGEPLSGLSDGLSASHASALDRALASTTPVALAYHRHGRKLNAVVSPPAEDAALGAAGVVSVVAEFIPFGDPPAGSAGADTARGHGQAP